MANRVEAAGGRNGVSSHFAEFWRRLCCLTIASPTISESLRIPAYVSKCNRAYLVQRKTKLSFAILCISIYVLYNFIVLGKSIAQPPELSGNANFANSLVSRYLDVDVVRLYYYYVDRISLGFTCIWAINLFLLIFARIFWYNYKISNRLLLSAFAIELMLPPIVLYLPFRTFFGNSNTPESFIVQSIILFYLMERFFHFLFPILFIPHNAIFVGDNLSRVYPSSSEFFVGSFVVVIFYFPFVLLLGGFLFQVDSTAVALALGSLQAPYDNVLLSLIFIYLALIAIPFALVPQQHATNAPSRLTRSAADILYYTLFTVFILLFGLELRRFGLVQKQLSTLVLSLMSSGILNYISLHDVMICVVVRARAEHGGPNSPHNLYSDGSSEDDNRDVRAVDFRGGAHNNPMDSGSGYELGDIEMTGSVVLETSSLTSVDRDGDSSSSLNLTGRNYTDSTDRRLRSNHSRPQAHYSPESVPSGDFQVQLNQFEGSQHHQASTAGTDDDSELEVTSRLHTGTDI